MTGTVKDGLRAYRKMFRNYADCYTPGKEKMLLEYLQNEPVQTYEEFARNNGMPQIPKDDELGELLDYALYVAPIALNAVAEKYRNKLNQDILKGDERFLFGILFKRTMEILDGRCDEHR